MPFFHFSSVVTSALDHNCSEFDKKDLNVQGEGEKTKSQNPEGHTLTSVIKDPLQSCLVTSSHEPLIFLAKGWVILHQLNPLSLIEIDWLDLFTWLPAFCALNKTIFYNPWWWQKNKSFFFFFSKRWYVFSADCDWLCNLYWNCWDWNWDLDWNYRFMYLSTKKGIQLHSHYLNY